MGFVGLERRAGIGVRGEPGGFAAQIEEEKTTMMGEGGLVVAGVSQGRGLFRNSCAWSGRATLIGTCLGWSVFPRPGGWLT